MRITKKGFWSVFVLSLLIGGIFGGIYLNQRYAIFEPEASPALPTGPRGDGIVIADCINGKKLTDGSPCYFACDDASQACKAKSGLPTKGEISCAGTTDNKNCKFYNTCVNDATSGLSCKKVRGEGASSCAIGASGDTFCKEGFGKKYCNTDTKVCSDLATICGKDASGNPISCPKKGVECTKDPNICGTPPPPEGKKFCNTLTKMCDSTPGAVECSSITDCLLVCEKSTRTCKFQKSVDPANIDPTVSCSDKAFNATCEPVGGRPEVKNFCDITSQACFPESAFANDPEKRKGASCARILENAECQLFCDTAAKICTTSNQISANNKGVACTTFGSDPLCTPPPPTQALKCENNLCKMVVGLAANQDGCTSVNQSCGQPVTHLECNQTSRLCLEVTGAGANQDGCTSLNQACGQPVTHLACDQTSKVCVAVAGAGANEDGCNTLSEVCGQQPPPATHLACDQTSKLCISVSGSGPNEDGCNSLSQSCGSPPPPPPAQFLKCVSNSCQFDSSLTSNQDGCTAENQTCGAPQSHLVCNTTTRKCEKIDGPGDDSSDCNAENQTCGPLQYVCDTRKTTQACLVKSSIPLEFQGPECDGVSDTSCDRPIATPEYVCDSSRNACVDKATISNSSNVGPDCAGLDDTVSCDLVCDTSSKTCNFFTEVDSSTRGLACNSLGGTCGENTTTISDKEYQCDVTTSACALLPKGSGTRCIGPNDNDVCQLRCDNSKGTCQARGSISTSNLGSSCTKLGERGNCSVGAVSLTSHMECRDTVCVRVSGPAQVGAVLCSPANPCDPKVANVVVKTPPLAVGRAAFVPQSSVYYTCSANRCVKMNGVPADGTILCKKQTDCALVKDPPKKAKGLGGLGISGGSLSAIVLSLILVFVGFVLIF